MGGPMASGRELWDRAVFDMTADPLHHGTGWAMWTPTDQSTSVSAPRPSSRSQVQGCLGPCRTSRRTSPSPFGMSMNTCRMTGSSRLMSFPSGERKMPRREICPVS